MEVSPKIATSVVMVGEMMISFISSTVRHKSITIKRRFVPKATFVFVTPKTSNPMASEWVSLSDSASLRA